MKGTFVFIALAICMANALPYGKGSAVKELTKKTFVNEIIASEHVAVVEFYAPWCGHCKNLEPEMERLGAKNKGIFKVTAINCDEEKELCGSFDIKGFPTIKIFPSETVSAGKKGQVQKKPVDYQGQRTASAIAQAALAKIPSFVTTVTDKSVDTFLSENEELAKVLLVSDKPKTTPLYKALAIDFHHRLVLGEAKNTDKAIVEKYSVSKFPTVLVITAAGEIVTYDGALKHEALYAFFNKYARPAPRGAQDAPSPTEKPTPPPKPEFVWKTEDEVADQETFEKVCHETSKMCLIALLDTQDTEKEVHQQNLELLSKVQEKNSDLFKVIWVDGPKNFEFGEKLGMSFGYPALITYNHKKAAKIPYIGNFNEEDLEDFLKGIRSGTRRARPAPSFPSLKSSGNKSADKAETQAPKKEKDEL